MGRASAPSPYIVLRRRVSRILSHTTKAPVNWGHPGEGSLSKVPEWDEILARKAELVKKVLDSDLKDIELLKKSKLFHEKELNDIKALLDYKLLPSNLEYKESRSPVERKFVKMLRDTIVKREVASASVKPFLQTRIEWIRKVWNGKVFTSQRLPKGYFFPREQKLIDDLIELRGRTLLLSPKELNKTVRKYRSLTSFDSGKSLLEYKLLHQIGMEVLLGRIYSWPAYEARHWALFGSDTNWRGRESAFSFSVRNLLSPGAEKKKEWSGFEDDVVRQTEEFRNQIAKLEQGK
ncbi:MAG: hypothetical protein V1847_04280 [Candidatus Diapherotrites archaeon]